jgi:hypothetical protein
MQTTLKLHLLVGASLLLVALAAPTSRRPAYAAPAAKDSVTAADLIQPAELAPLLALSPDQRPALLHVGFQALYRTAHVAGSRYAGPGSKPEGLRALKLALKPLPRDREVVLYCGCCPWKDCPNVRPAFRTARAMGFKHVRVLYLAKNLRQSGLDAGLPESKGD